ncbi:MAG: LamG-like jellyroll fold domain-containing protein [Armatimonadota bacterium]|nr:LamG-like jellyroll fold domain-containing protein [Armatimonadota bacterium]
MTRAIRAAAIALIFGCIPALCLAQTPILTVPFDGSDAAMLSLNGAEEIVGFATMGGPYVMGLKGRARELGGMNRLRFFLNEGLVPPEGTLSLWARPLDWTPADARHFVFFARLDFTENEQGYVRMILYKYWNTDEIAMLVQNTPLTERSALIRVPAPDWEEGYWHHLAITWDAERYRLYIDGQQAGEAPAIMLPAEGRWELSVGTPCEGWKYIGDEKNAIDEFAIYAEALSAETIHSQYEQMLAAARPEALTPPEQAGPPPVEGNLALADDGAWVIASSFADYEEHYSDNLIDGREESVWAPLTPTLPQWLEMRWRLPRRVDGVVLRQSEPAHVAALTVDAWLDGDWEQVGSLADVPAEASELRAQFDAITTDRVRVTLNEGEPEGLELSTLAVIGPEQPILPPTPVTPDEPERVTVLDASVAPEGVEPGEMVRVEATVTSDGALAEDYIFAFEIAETPQEAGWSDLFVAGMAVAADTPTSQWQAGQEHVLSAEVRLPEWAPDGPVPVRLVGMRAQGTTLQAVDGDGQPLEAVATVEIERFDGRVVAGVAGARLNVTGGVARWVLGEESVPPIGWAMTTPSWDRYHHYSSTGVRVYHAKTLPLSFDDAPGHFERVCSQLDERMRHALRVDPGALFIVNPDLRPEQAWLARNPGERLVTAQGNLGPISFSSAKYTEAVHQFLRRLIRYVHAQDYADHVIGWLPYVCGSPDSVMGGTEDNLFQEDRTRLTFGDHNPQAIAAFQAWLRDKYESLEDLRAAWQDPDLTFETARPVMAEITAEGVDGGVFRDPSGNQMTFDYAEWMSGVVGRFNSDLMGIVKEEAGREVLAGTYYGYNVAHLRGYNTPGSWLQNNNFDFHERLQDPNWDFFAEPTPYSSRRPGTSYYTSHTSGSLRLHGKLHMAEIDHRTFMAGQKRYGRMRSERETQAVMRRDMSALIIAGQGYWFSDWSRDERRDLVPWFAQPGILGAIEEARETHQSTMSRERESAAQIAVITSGRTMRYHDVYRTSPLYHNLIPLTLWDAMGKIGAPYDIFTIEDLAAPEVHDGYRLYVFLNAFFLRSEDRERIDALKSDGRTLLFFYAPGYATRERGLSLDVMADVTGINVVERANPEWMEYHLTNYGSSLLGTAEADSTVRIEAFGYELSRKLHPPEFGPVFAIDDPNTAVLGTYPDGQPALAVRDYSHWRSVYCAVPRMTSAILRGVARLADVHLYCEEDVVLDADDRLLMLHSGWDGDRDLEVALPRPMTVTDAWTGATLCTDAEGLTVTLPESTTRLLHLK